VLFQSYRVIKDKEMTNKYLSEHPLATQKSDSSTNHLTHFWYTEYATAIPPLGKNLTQLTRPTTGNPAGSRHIIHLLPHIQAFLTHHHFTSLEMGATSGEGRSVPGLHH
jgi:hypothetical protein